MSAFIDRADEIKAVIDGLFDEDTISCVVDKQMDIKSQFDKSIGRIKGGVVIVDWKGLSKINPDGVTLRGTASYQLTCIYKPILRDGDVDAYAITNDIAKA